MSCGDTHTRMTYYTAGATGIFMSYTGIGILHAATVSAGVLLGLYINPDLDVRNSDPHRRWGILKFIWYPYQRSFGHRGSFFRRNFWTHMPGIGLIIRVFPLIIFLLYLRGGQPFPPLAVSYGGLIVLGILINDVIHLMCDILQSYIGILK